MANNDIVGNNSQEGKIIDFRPKAKAEEYDRCVACRKTTEYKKDTPINKRENYVEGGGQLCKECYCEIYGN